MDKRRQSSAADEIVAAATRPFIPAKVESRRKALTRCRAPSRLHADDGIDLKPSIKLCPLRYPLQGMPRQACAAR